MGTGILEINLLIYNFTHMSYVDLDKVINVTGWGGGTVYPDVPYPVLNQRIGIFSKPNAWDTDSNGWFGLLNSDVSSICSQNYNFNQQIAVAVDSGVSALSTRVKSYDFSIDIDKVDSGQVLFWLMHAPSLNTFSIDESLKVIDSWYISWQNISANKYNRKAFIITSGANRYLLLSTWPTIEVYPVDVNNKITWASVESITYSYSGTYATEWIMPIAVVGNYIRCVDNSHISSSNTADVHSEWLLFSIASNGAATLIDNKSLLSQNSWWNSTHSIWFNSASYQYDNTICYLFVHDGVNGLSSWIRDADLYCSIDLTNTSTFTLTTIYTTSTFSGWSLNDRDLIAGWYDGTGMLVVNGTSIYRRTATGKSASLWTYIWTQYDQISKKNTLTYYTVGANNISTNATYMNILGSYIWWDTLSAVYNNMVFVYEPLSAQSEDDSFVCCMTNLTPFADWDSVDVNINSTFNNTYDLSNKLYNQYSVVGKVIPLLTQAIAVPSVEIEVVYTNTLWNDLKLWFWITWWTYATPTLPSNNWLSGNATTARTAGSSASYIDLTLST